MRWFVRGLTIMHWLTVWKTWAKQLKTDVVAIFLAMQDRRVPWYTKAIAFLVVGYALSPVDLVPDFVPILGYLDDLVLLPFGIKLVKSLIPDYILEEYREKAKLLKADVKRKSWIAAGIIISIWILAIISIVLLIKYKM